MYIEMFLEKIRLEPSFTFRFLCHVKNEKQTC